MIVSNIRPMLESSEIEDGGAAATVGSTHVSAVGSLEEGGGGGVTPKEERAFRASSYLSSSLPKEGDTYRSCNVYGLRSRKLI